MTGAVTWEIVGAFLALAGFFGGFSWRLQSLISKNRDKVDELRKDFSDYRLGAANKFVSLQHMEQFEDRMLGAINRLADRLDRIIERSRSE